MSPQAVASSYENYPPRWITFTTAVHVFGPEFSFGFAESVAEVNRFAARYRAAKCFREVKFAGVTASTADGYSALCQILLTYSAFEHLLRCLGISLNKASALLSNMELSRVLMRLRQLHGSRDLFTVLRLFLNQNNQRLIDDYVAGRRCNPFQLAACIRHAFAHGKLTATPVNAPPESVATVSRYLCKILMKVMDREFERRVNEFEAELLETARRGSNTEG